MAAAVLRGVKKGAVLSQKQQNLIRDPAYDCSKIICGDSAKTGVLVGDRTQTQHTSDPSVPSLTNKRYLREHKIKTVMNHYGVS